MLLVQYNSHAHKEKFKSLYRRQRLPVKNESKLGFLDSNLSDFHWKLIQIVKFSKVTGSSPGVYPFTFRDIMDCLGKSLLVQQSINVDSKSINK